MNNNMNNERENNYTVMFDGYTLTVKNLSKNSMIIINKWGDEFRMEFITTEKEVKLTSFKRADGGYVSSVWYYIPRKLEEAILNGLTF